MVPIVKGRGRLVLVGDHVQLRATVQLHATALGSDVSLFESLWFNDYGIGKTMLDTQYRMYLKVCNFPSGEFYEARLKTHASCESIEVPRSTFVWPVHYRMIFVQSSSAEDLGRKSKSKYWTGKPLLENRIPSARNQRRGQKFDCNTYTIYTSSREAEARIARRVHTQN